MEQEEKGKKKQRRVKQKRTTSTLDMTQLVSDQDLSKLTQKDQAYHIEPNGQVIVIKRPQVERLPRQYVANLQASLTQPIQVEESEFNRTMKHQNGDSMVTIDTQIAQ